MSALSNLTQSQVTALNDRWKNEFFPSLQQNNPSLELTDPPYEFGEMVAKIHQILCEGKKACLFIGRTSSEPLPPNNQEEEWISADMWRVSSGEKSLPGRIHLWIDCNQQRTIECLEKLFDRIVIDWSTIKFLNNDFTKRFSVMFHSRESTLMFEPGKGRIWASNTVLEKTFDKQSYHISYPFSDDVAELKQWQEYMKSYYASQSADQQELDWQEFMKTPNGQAFAKSRFSRDRMKSNFEHFIIEKAGIESLSVQYAKWGIEQFKLHLESHFKQVELHLEQPFPYPNNWNGVGYFLVSHPTH